MSQEEVPYNALMLNVGTVDLALFDNVETNLVDVVSWIDQTDDSLVYTGRTGTWMLRK